MTWLEAQRLAREALEASVERESFKKYGVNEKHCWSCWLIVPESATGDVAHAPRCGVILARRALAALDATRPEDDPVLVEAVGRKLCVIFGNTADFDTDDDEHDGYVAEGRGILRLIGRLLAATPGKGQP